jgi:outer membrane protein TolC
VAVAQAEENLRIRRQQFDAGRATSDDVLDATALLAAQRATVATALYQAHTRRAELQALIGLPLDDLARQTR